MEEATNLLTVGKTLTWIEERKLYLALYFNVR